MPVILSIETATAACSVAISKDNSILFVNESREEKSHASSLAVFIDEGMKACSLKFSDIDAVAISKGPGSYTGLRIGVSTAKGICYGVNKPLIAINTLQTMTFGVIKELEGAENLNNSWFCPMIDARRMEVFTTFFDLNLDQQTEIAADIIDENSYKEILDKRIVYFFGDGAEKCNSIINHPNAKFVHNIFPHAENMVPIAQKHYAEKKFEDTAYFEPFYLKDFIATIPKKHIYK